jgi:TolB protein
VVVSLGFPNIAFDQGGNLQVMGGATGKPVKPLAASEEVEEHPSFSPDGTVVAYRRGTDAGGRIWLVDVADPQSARPLTEEGFDDRRPAFAPNGKVIALVRGAPGGDFDLCFIRVDSQNGKPRCIVDPERNVSRPAWSPDGRSVVVVSTDPGAGGTQTELGLYQSARGSSGKPGEWTFNGLVTNDWHGDREGDQVVAAAFSPDGTQLAYTANWGARFVRLFLSPVADGVIERGKPKAQIRGCEVAWRPDGLEFALTRRDAACNQPGEIVRVDPANPKEQVALTKLGAGDPAWSPVAAAAEE